MKQRPPARESVTATATQDRTPKVGIALSSFAGASDHDGTEMRGLADPRPAGAPLTDAQFAALLRKTIELSLRGRSARGIAAADEWVLVLPGAAEPRLVRAVADFLAGAGCGARITFGGLSWRGLAGQCARAHPKVRFEAADLAAAVELPVRGQEARTARVAAVVQRCDRLVALASLAGSGPLSIVSYRAAGTAAAGDDPLLDLFAFHPADLAILSAGRRNLMVAGTSAVAVDAVGAAILGLDPARIPLLERAWRRGFGIYDPDSIWTRGNAIDEARGALKENA
jgi:hypothetical protein